MAQLYTQQCSHCQGHRKIPWEFSPSGWERDDSIRRENQGRWVTCPTCQGTGVEQTTLPPPHLVQRDFPD